jgi:hypothetical protein
MRYGVFMINHESDNAECRTSPTNDAPHTASDAERMRAQAERHGLSATALASLVPASAWFDWMLPQEKDLP